MTNPKKKSGSKTVAKDMLIGLDADVVGVASLSQYKGSRLEESALRLLPETHSIIVFGLEIHREILDLSSPSRIQGAASTTDLLNTDSQHLSGRLTWTAYDISRAAHDLGFKALPLPSRDCPTDNRFFEAILSYKHAGEAAGLGKLGWHSMLISSGFGPRLRLGVCLTEAEMEPTPASNVRFNCERCRKCVEVCPAQAINEPAPGEPYSINKFACSAYLEAAGGCSQCMRVCPPGMLKGPRNND
jgi:epoxyqueuosine reductase QueG